MSVDRASWVDERLQESLRLHKVGQLGAAQAMYSEILQIDPQCLDALYLSGLIAAQAGDLVRATEFFGRSLEIDADNAQIHHNHGTVLMGLKRYEVAVESFGHAIRLNPDYALAYCNRGVALVRLSQYDAAITNYDRALQLQPDYVDAHAYRGLALLRLRRYQEAVQSCQQALRLDGACRDAYVGLGEAFKGLMRYDAAAQNYGVAIQMGAKDVEVYRNQALVLMELRQHQAAIAVLDQALQLQPGYDYLFGLRLHLQMQVCSWENLDAQLVELQEKIKHDEKACFMLPLVALSSVLTLQHQAARAYAAANHPQNDALGSMARRPRRDKIRVGYYSADFHEHATAYLMAELFERHDRDRFEIVAFSWGPVTDDAMQKRVRQAFDVFVDVSDQTDEEVARLSRKLEIDIAVDLKGYTGNYRLGIFACRAAPVQVSYLGYPGTVGASYIDYLIADGILIAPEDRAHYSEKIAYLPDSYQANVTRQEVADGGGERQALGLPQSGFVFCCFNNNYKIMPDTFDGWMRILTKVDGSVLWLLGDNPVAIKNLRCEAERRGVEASRLVFADRVPLTEHLARHRAADLFLDTQPCNAHTTASDALRMGLPVLTCVGEAFASRVAASLLHAVGLPEMIVSSQDSYEALAIELATQPGRLQHIRKKLAQNCATAPLFDAPRFVRHIESAYVQMAERHFAGLTPEHIHVQARSGESS